MKKRIIVTLRLFGYGLVHTMDGSEEFRKLPTLSTLGALHYISGCFTHTRVRRGAVVDAPARHLLWSAKLNIVSRIV